MNTYPALLTDHGSDPQPLGKNQIDRAEDNTARARNFGVADKVQIKIQHSSITSADKSALDSFYAANKLLKFTYVSPADGVSRTCLFASAPSYKREPGNYWTAIVMLEEA